MRCPQCGTQNEPDSRFCGGCGARTTGGETRLAPTEKIQSDAPMQVQPLGSISPAAGIAASRRVSAPPEMPPPTPVPAPRQDVMAMPASIPPSNHGQWSASPPSLDGTPSLAPQGSSGAARPPVMGSTPSIAPQNQVGASTGPARSIPQPAPASSERAARPSTSAAGMSMRPARTRWGLIIVLLLFDAGLATAGTWMLLEGLADPPAATAPPTTSGAIKPAPTSLRVADVKDAPATPAPASPATPVAPPVAPPPPPSESAAAAAPLPVDKAPLDTTPPVPAKPLAARSEPAPATDPPVDKPADQPVEKPPVDKPADKARRSDDKKAIRKKPKDGGRTGPEDPYGDPLPPESK